MATIRALPAADLVSAAHAAGFALSTSGVIARGVLVAYCAWCDRAHPLDLSCAHTSVGGAPEEANSA